MYHLVVKDRFENWVPGDMIKDQDTVNRVLAGHNRIHVVKIAAPPQPDIAEADVDTDQH